MDDGVKRLGREGFNLRSVETDMPEPSSTDERNTQAINLNNIKNKRKRSHGNHAHSHNPNGGPYNPPNGPRAA